MREWDGMKRWRGCPLYRGRGGGFALPPRKGAPALVLAAAPTNPSWVVGLARVWRMGQVLQLSPCVPFPMGPKWPNSWCSPN